MKPKMYCELFMGLDILDLFGTPAARLTRHSSELPPLNTAIVKPNTEIPRRPLITVMAGGK